MFIYLALFLLKWNVIVSQLKAARFNMPIARSVVFIQVLNINHFVNWNTIEYYMFVFKDIMIALPNLFHKNASLHFT